MKKIDNMDLDELKAHQKEIDAAIKTYAKKKKTEALKAVRQTAKEYGFTLDELIGGAATGGGTATKGAPKYANPADASQTWTGRGRQPQWIKDALASGKSLDDMAI